MARNKVDFPEPERPSRPTISPGRSVRFTFSSTTSSSPSGLRKDLQTPCTSSNGARFMAWAFAFMDWLLLTHSLTHSKSTLGPGVQRLPEHPVDHDYKQRHY